MITICIILSLFFTQKATIAPASLPDFVSSYMAIKDALVASSFEKAQLEITELARLNMELKAIKNSSKEQAAYLALEKEFSQSIVALQKAGNIEDQRSIFASLSLSMHRLIEKAIIGNEPLYWFYCPMKKAYWFSYSEVVENPYYGSGMLTCGSLKNTY